MGVQRAMTEANEYRDSGKGGSEQGAPWGGVYRGYVGSNGVQRHGYGGEGSSN